MDGDWRLGMEEEEALTGDEHPSERDREGHEEVVL